MGKSVAAGAARPTLPSELEPGKTAHELRLPGATFTRPWQPSERFLGQRKRLNLPIAAEATDENRLQALIRLEVACQLALEALTHLPRDAENRLREPIQTLCDVTRAELERVG